MEKLETKRNPSFRPRFRKCAAIRLASPTALRPSPKNPSDLNKTVLKAILKINEIVTRVVQEYFVLWWKKHCRIDIVNHNINISGDLS
jgi:hypothetical protein